MNWRKAVKDWRVWAGAGVVGLLGVVALVRRQNAAGGDTSGAYTTPPATSAAGGRPGDTTGTDLAGYLSSFFQSQLDAQKEFLESIKDTIDGGDDGGQTTPPPTSTPNNPPPTSQPKYVPVVKYTSSNPPWNSTLSGIAKHEGTTVANLLNLNPFITNPNLIHPGWNIRVS